MVRSITVVALALALFAAPLSAEGEHPLRTFCSSPTHDYCVSIYSFEYSYMIKSPDFFPYAEANFNLWTRWFGPGFENGGPFRIEIHADVANDPDSYGGRIYGHALQGPSSVPGAGWYWIGDEDVLSTDILDNPTIDDLTRVIVFDPRLGVACSNGGRPGYPRCVSVPEPGSLLLLASGVLGLAYVRRRRLTGAP